MTVITHSEEKIIQHTVASDQTYQIQRPSVTILLKQNTSSHNCDQLKITNHHLHPTAIQIQPNMSIVTHTQSCLYLTVPARSGGMGRMLESSGPLPQVHLPQQLCHTLQKTCKLFTSYRRENQSPWSRGDPFFKF